MQGLSQPERLLQVPLRTAAELSYRAANTKRYLDQVISGEAGDHLRVREIRDLVALAIQAIQEHLPKTVGQALSSYSKNPDESIQVFLDNLRLFSHWFLQIHELLVYLPRRPAPTQTVALLSSSFGKEFQRHKPSIILGSLFNALEFDFFELMRSRIPDLEEIDVSNKNRVVLQIAVCDKDSPPAWAILAHEMGHAIDQQENISAEVVSTYIKDPKSEVYKIILAWCGEFCADLIAAHVLGPAPMMALLSFEYCVYPLCPIYQSSKTHPTTKWRLDVVADYLRRKCGGVNYLQQEVEDYTMAWTLSVGPDKRNSVEESDKKQFNNIASPLVDALEQKIEALRLPTFTLDPGALERCLLRLGHGSPIGAQGTPRETLRAALRNYRKRDFESKEERRRTFSELAEKFAENPLDVQSIMLSCYQKRLMDMGAVVHGATPFNTTEAVSEICKRFQRLDELIAYSINTSTIHRQLLRSKQRS